MTKITIAGATLNQTPLDWKHNVSNILAAVNEAKRQKVDILCFPELCITGYGCEDLFLTNWLTAEAWKQLNAIVPHCDNIAVCVGLPVRMNDKTYNGVCVIVNQRILGVTLKQNLANDGVHYEPRWFLPWKAGEVADLVIEGNPIRVGDLTYETRGVTFGFEICEDAWSKVRPGHNLRKKGVDIILNPSASHFALGKSTAREKEVIIDGSKMFDCVYLFVNHLGNEAGRMIYDGDIVIGQRGTLLAVNRRLSFRPFNLLAVTVDTTDASKSQIQAPTDGRERNEEFARAASLALYDYLRKSKARGFVLSLSGGADSSCCTVLVSEMVKRASAELGWEAFWTSLGYDHKKSPKSVQAAIKVLLTCAYQSTQHSSEATRQAAEGLATSVGAEFFAWSIDTQTAQNTRTIEEVIGRPLTWDQDDIAMQNIQARSRSPIIWLLANIKRSILLTTSNRSEGDVGYATMDGDTSGSLAPLAGIDKPFILQWLAWAEVHLNYQALRAVNKLEPTAELRPTGQSQSDEKDLMPYVVLSEIERLAILGRQSPVQVFDQLKGKHHPAQLKAWIRKYFMLWAANQWKRERFAPSFHFDDFNVDPRSWCRFPILSGGFEEELAQLDSRPN